MITTINHTHTHTFILAFNGKNRGELAIKENSIYKRVGGGGDGEKYF